MSALLFEEHRLIQSAADAFLKGLRQGPDAAGDRLPLLRAQLASQMTRHRATQESLLLGPFMSAGGFEHVPEVFAHVQLLRREWLNYSQHVRHWTPKAIEADWDGYTAAVQHRVEVLKTLTPYEEREVYAPILRFLGQQGLASESAATR